MTAYSKAARRARRKRITKRDLEAVREIVNPPPQEIYEDPRTVVIEARARMMSKEPGPDMLADMLCEHAGQAINIGARDKDEAGKLWADFRRLDAADETYFRRIIGKPRFPNVARLEMMPETFEARPDDRPDSRTDEEKNRDAVNAWMRWHGILNRLASHERATIMSAIRQTSGDLHKRGGLTTSGQAFIAAMRVLRSEVERG